MSGIKYYALRTDEDPPEEFIVIKNVDGEPEFITSYVNSNYLSYENGVLLKMHERNDALRAENAKLWKFATETWELLTCNEPVFVWKELQKLAHNLGIEEIK